MTDFVDDLTDPPSTKSDAPGLSHAPSADYIVASDVNTLSAATTSLRTAILGGKQHGLRKVTGLPTADSNLAQFVNLNGELVAMEGTSTARRVFGTSINVADYGTVDRTGVADSTAAINAAIQAARALVSNLNYGCIIKLGRGTFKVTDTILINECLGITLEGEGKNATSLVSSGMTGLPIIQLRNASKSGVKNLTVLGELAHPPMCGIEIRRQSGFTAGYGSTKNFVTDVLMGNDSAYRMGKGISISGDLDANNDFHKFTRVDSYSATIADAAIDNSQSVGHQFLHCEFASPSTYGINVGGGIRDRVGDNGLTQGGKFTWRGGSVGNHTAWNFYVGGEGPGVNSIDDCGSEGSGGFLGSSSLPGVTSSININNVRFSTESFQATAYAINWGLSGHFHMTNCRFDVASGAGKFAKVKLSSSRPMTAFIVGNTWNQDGSDLTPMIEKSAVAASGSDPGGSFITTEGNLYSSAAGYFKYIGNQPVSGSKTWDPASVADGAMTSTTVTVTGAAIGDVVSVGFSVAVPAGAILAGSVTATDTVTVTLFNKTGGALDLASGTLSASTRKV